MPTLQIDDGPIGIQEMNAGWTFPTPHFLLTLGRPQRIESSVIRVAYPSF